MLMTEFREEFGETVVNSMIQSPKILPRILLLSKMG
jgi:hypothetical protein